MWIRNLLQSIYVNKGKHWEMLRSFMHIPSTVQWNHLDMTADRVFVIFEFSFNNSAMNFGIFGLS